MWPASCHGLVDPDGLRHRHEGLAVGVVSLVAEPHTQLAPPLKELAVCIRIAI